MHPKIPTSWTYLEKFFYSRIFLKKDLGFLFGFIILRVLVKVPLLSHTLKKFDILNAGQIQKPTKEKLC